MTSSHTSFAAARAPARSPSAALLQIDSTFAFVLDPSVGASLITDLHSATASATAAESAAFGVVLGVLLVLEAVPVDAGVELVVAAGELLWLLVEEELLLLPQPAMNTLPMSATTSHLDLCLIIFAPSIDRIMDVCPAASLPPAGARVPATLLPCADPLPEPHSSAGVALRSLITLAVRPPRALNSMPAIPVITIRNGGKLPSETFAWVPTSACTSSKAIP